MSNAHVSLVFEVSVKEGREADARTLVAEMVEATRGEPGTLDYEIHATEDGRRFLSFERYADTDAALTHLGAFGTRWMARFFDVFVPERMIVFGEPNDAVRGALAAAAPTYMREVAGFSRYAEMVS